MRTAAEGAVGGGDEVEVGDLHRVERIRSELLHVVAEIDLDRLLGFEAGNVLAVGARGEAVDEAAIRMVDVVGDEGDSIVPKRTRRCTEDEIFVVIFGEDDLFCFE